MIVDFDNSKKNLGSSKKMFEYLNKENKGKFDDEKDLLFNQFRDDITPEEATETIDKNVAKLSKNEEKYFSFHISPSASEIKQIDGDTQKMKDFVRNVMDEYAKNFNKGLTAKDLVYFAKIERTREFKNKDIEVQNGFSAVGQKKTGDQLHVHVVVSRKDVTNTKKLSPKDNAKGGSNFHVPGKEKTISRGFDRNKFFNKVESLFDSTFNYHRTPEESYEFRRLQKHHPEEFSQKFSQKKTFNPGISNLSTEFNKREYTERHINRILTKGQSKNKADQYFKERGISIDKKGINLNGSSISFDHINFTKEAGEMLKAFYLTKQLGKNIEGKDEEKEK
ncbi:MAG: hypothetical protein DI589_18845 [Shinella sp.]|nr:MAG: hypothetical protein DI589_18845 [Shinella sp.]